MELPTRKQTLAQTNKKRFTKCAPRKCNRSKSQTSKYAFQSSTKVKPMPKLDMDRLRICTAHDVVLINVNDPLRKTISVLGNDNI